MDSLKDSLRDSSKTVTLTSSQLNFLSNVHNYVQSQLDILQERLAGAYLNQLAVDEFGMDPKKDFIFDFHPEKEHDNLTITEKINRK